MNQHASRERAKAAVPDPTEFAACYAARVHRFAAMLTKNDQDSVDLAQEALVKALGGLSLFDPARGSMEAWLWRIVINTAKDNGRLRMRRRLLAERWLRDHRSIGQATVEDTAIARLRDAELLAAVRHLPVRARSIIALRYGAQLGIREIGGHLGMTPGAVSMAIERALARLKRDLENIS